MPPALLQPALDALSYHISNANKNLGLDMHLGHILVKDLYNAGCFLKIAKFDTGEGLTKAVIIGDGIIEAEKLIKKEEETAQSKQPSGVANMDGLECRWNSIKPPENATEVVCFLISATNPREQMTIFKDVLEKMGSVFGDSDQRHPLSTERLKLLITYDKIKKEMIVKYGKWKPFYFLKTLFQTVAGFFYFKYNFQSDKVRGRVYLKQVISNSDILMIDGRINSIVSGTAQQRLQFTSYLKEQEDMGLLIFGHHVSDESIMTCYIQNRNQDHIHFVDGSKGGYTMAALEIKAKLRAKNER